MNSGTTISLHGPALRALRKAGGVGVAELASRIDCDRSYVARLELGHARAVSPTVFARLIAALAIEDDRAIRLNPYGAAQ